MITILISLLSGAIAFASTAPRLAILGPVAYRAFDAKATDDIAPLHFEQRLGHLGPSDVAKITDDMNLGEFLSHKMATRLFKTSRLELTLAFAESDVRLVAVGFDSTRGRGRARVKGTPAVRGSERAYVEYVRDLAAQNPERLFLVVAPEDGNLRQDVFDIFADAALPNVIVTAIEGPARLPGVDTNAPIDVLLRTSIARLTNMHNSTLTEIRDFVIRESDAADGVPCGTNLAGSPAR